MGVDIDALINSIDIVDFISQFADVEFKNGEYWCLSPLSSEKTPSFSMRKETNKYYDFSSGTGGSVFTFIQRFYKCSASKAVDIMKEYVSNNDIDISQQRKMSATTVFKKFASRPVKKLEHRTVLPDDYMEKFSVDPDKLAIWVNEGISPEVLEEFDVRYDKFSDRLVYPIREIDSGRIVNVGGRTLKQNFKELGLKKYCYFFGWENGMDVIYGLQTKPINKNNIFSSMADVIIFEGCKSVLLANSWGISNVGAILTSHLNEQQMKILAKLGRTVVFALDKDVDITKDRHIQSLKKYVNVEYIKDMWGILDEKDSPVDKGYDAFAELYNRRRKLK